MKNWQIIVILVFFCFLPQSLNGQISEEIENWIQPNDIPLRLVFRRYDKTDVENAKKKMEFFRKKKLNGEWEGSYNYSLGIVNAEAIHISKELGFIEYNYYTCFPRLDYLNYGKIYETADLITLFPESSPTSPRNKYKKKELVKVKWHGDYYLVFEDDLINFSKMTAGLYVMKEDFAQPDFGYYIKEAKSKKFDTKVEEMPVYPNRFNKYLLKPIKTQILDILNRTYKAERNQWNNEIERTVEYKVLLGAGKSVGAESGMSFYVTDKNELIKIIDVNNKTSIGLITREADSNGNDHCTDDEYKEIQCIEIKKGQITKTKSQFYLFE